MSSVTLNLDSSEVPLARFRQAVTSFLEMIEEVSKTQTGEKLNWTISVQKGSAVVIATCDQPAAKTVSTTLPRALKELENGAEQLPEGFSEKAARAARKLAKTKGKGPDIIPITIHSGRAKASISEKTSSSVDDLIEASHQSFGSLEGRLYLLSDQNGFTIRIHQQLFKRDITCFLKEEQIELALKAFRSRVRVTGRIQYNRFDKPVSIKVSDFVAFPSNDELPSPSEMKGILA